ncbi:hypothetical protein PC128_g7622 [Phytophthora cactorum]|nr:hypothetical protein PC128_g7622 [Phytophthora cactorum]
MVSTVTKVLAALAMLASFAVAEMQAKGHIRGSEPMALVLSKEEAAGDSCDASNGQGCQHQLSEQDAGHQDAPPEFVPTKEWQDILPNQAIPPGLYIRVNLETGKKEAKLLDYAALVTSTTRGSVRQHTSAHCNAVRKRRTAVASDNQGANTAAPLMFEPTHEWREILPNEVLPAGLHIRLNLQTGQKEAKLLDY